MTKLAKPLDVAARLISTADQVDDRPIDEIEALLREAAQVILLLRDLVGIRDEIELEDAEPAGRA